MPLTLQAIAYVSTATAMPSEADLQRLLTTARQRNHEHQVTGVLLHHGGSFFQYIEGPAEHLAEVYRIIQTASGHHGLIQLLHEPISERVFPDWQMGFTESTQSALLTISQANWQRACSGLGQRPSPSPGLALLLSFWQGTRL